MDAIKLLKRQHRLVEKLFARFEESDSDGEKQQLLFAIADNLAVHATIEERHFYPAVRERQTEGEVLEAYDEHLEIKRLILDCLHKTEAPGFDGIVAALKGCVEHHVEEEESEFFPHVQQLFTTEAMEALGQTMEAESEQLMAAGEPRKNVKVESEQPAASL
jgi:hemerythrin superfamily protein